DPSVGVNLVSAVAGALAVGLFYALVYEIVRHHLQLPGSALSSPSSSLSASRRAKGLTVPANGRSNSGRAAQAQAQKSKSLQTGTGSRGYERQSPVGAIEREAS